MFHKILPCCFLNNMSQSSTNNKLGYSSLQFSACLYVLVIHSNDHKYAGKKNIRKKYLFYFYF